MCLASPLEVVEILVGRVARVIFVLDAVEAGEHHRREGEVRIGTESGKRTSCVAPGIDTHGCESRRSGCAPSRRASLQPKPGRALVAVGAGAAKALSAFARLMMPPM
jgi:hypothetical protein